MTLRSATSIARLRWALKKSSTYLRVRLRAFCFSASSGSHLALLACKHTNGLLSNRTSVFFAVGVATCLTGALSATLGLVLGIVFAAATRNSPACIPKKLISWTLGLAIVGLGTGLDIGVIGRQGLSSVTVTLGFIGGTFLVSRYIGRYLRTNDEFSLLIASGTAICGGSAIAAVSAVTRARSESVTLALGCVFILNFIALLVFPCFGHWIGLSEPEFGLWSALAIHDTSSVVAASFQYGPGAVGVATSTKLVRALWIAPVSLCVGTSGTRRTDSLKILSRQWFIVGFLAMSCAFSWFPELAPYAKAATEGARRLMVLSLFLVGAGFTVESLKKTGIRPLIHSVILWISLAVISLLIVIAGWVSA